MSDVISSGQNPAEEVLFNKERTFGAWFWFSYFTWYGSIGRMAYFKAWLFAWAAYIIFAGPLFLSFFYQGISSEKTMTYLLYGTGPAFNLALLFNIMLTFLAAKRLQSRHASPYIAVAMLAIKYFFIVVSIVASAGGVQEVGKTGGMMPVSSLFTIFFWTYLFSAEPLRGEFTLPDDKPCGLGGMLILALAPLVYGLWHYSRHLYNMWRVLDSSDWGIYAQAGTLFYAPPLKPILFVEAFLCVLALVGIVCTFYLFFRKRTKFVRVCSLCLVGFVGISIYQLIAYCNYTYLLSELGGVNIIMVINTLAACFFIPYLYTSRRVRLTFTF